MKIKEFLEGRGIERQAVTRYINRHEEIFKGHTKKIGKEIELDMVAVGELEKVYPLPKPVEVITDTDTLRRLSEAQNRIIELQGVLQSQTLKLAQAEAVQMLLEDRTQQLADAKDEVSRLRAELEQEKQKTWWDKLVHKK